MYGDNRGPSCLHLTNPPWSQSDPVRHQPDFHDGVNAPTGKGTDRVAPSYGVSAGTGYAGSAAEADASQAAARAATGRAGLDVPDLGVLLVGPMARGAKVSLR